MALPCFVGQTLGCWVRHLVVALETLLLRHTPCHIPACVSVAVAVVTIAIGVVVVVIPVHVLTCPAMWPLGSSPVGPRVKCVSRREENKNG